MATNKIVLSNIVDGDALRKVQLSTLNIISKVVSKTQGPAGSATMLLHQDRLTEYSKDGHKVLENIKFFKPLEQAIHDELLGITSFVVKKVGDGTTEATIMSNIIFELLCDYEKEHPELPQHIIINKFQQAVKNLSDKILSNAKELTIDDIYEICMISTNGNERVSSEIASIYKDFGTDVYIEVSASNTENSVTKAYDGVSMNKGYPSPAFINNDKGTVEIRNPRIYYFPDPVDTPEMINMFEAIFYQNIYEPYSKGQAEKYVPTVILVPSISRDLQTSLADIEKIFYAFDKGGAKTSKPPFCIISGINDRVDNIEDIVMLCDCKPIKRYINPEVQQKDIEAGNAPTPETVTEWYGKADMVELDINKTKFINPSAMYKDELDENGNRVFSDVYNGLLAHLEAELKLAQEDNQDINLTGNIKRRLNHLKSNFVQYFVGGVSAADRDNVRDLVEDAVLNCRSAATSGYGYGAGYEGLVASHNMAMAGTTKDEVLYDMHSLLLDAYMKYVKDLYMTVMTEQEAKDTIDSILCENIAYPINLRQYPDPTTERVLCSINTEVIILEAISKIITIMFTANQAMLLDPTQNAYLKLDEE